MINETFRSLSKADNSLIYSFDYPNTDVSFGEYNLIVCTSLQRFGNPQAVVTKILSDLDINGTAIFVLNRHMASSNFEKLMIQHGFKINHINERFKIINNPLLSEQENLAALAASYSNYLVVATKKDVISTNSADLPQGPLIVPTLIRDEISMFAQLLRNMAKREKDTDIITDANEVFGLLGLLGNDVAVRLNSSELSKVVRSFINVGFPADKKYQIPLGNRNRGLSEVLQNIRADLIAIGITNPDHLSPDEIEQLDMENIYYAMSYQLIKWAERSNNALQITI